MQYTNTVLLMCLINLWKTGTWLQFNSMSFFILMHKLLLEKPFSKKFKKAAVDLLLTPCTSPDSPLPLMLHNNYISYNRHNSYPFFELRGWAVKYII